MPARARSLLVTLAVIAALFALDFGFDKVIPDTSLRILCMTLAVNVVVAISLNVINGMAGQFSIGHAGFVGMGAYAAAIVASNMHHALGGGDPFHPPFLHSFLVVPIALVVAAAVAGVFGFLLGLPSLRLKGDYLAIVTLGFAEIFRLVISTAESTTETASSAFANVHGIDSFFHAVGVGVAQLGGMSGYQGVPGPGGRVDGVPLYAGPLWVFGVAALVCLLAWRLKFSGWGRALRALREDEIAAAAVGVDPTRYKVTSFVIAAIGGGIAGGLMAMTRDGSPVVQPDAFGFQASFDAITMVIIGGSGSVSGAVLGAFFLTFSIKAIEFVEDIDAISDLKAQVQWLDFNALRMILYACVLVALMIMRPEGILGERELFQKKGKRPPDKPLAAAPAGA